MTETKYTYSISGDFPNQKVNSDSLKNEIDESAIVTALSYINTNLDDCDIWFGDALSGGDETILNGIVATHQGNPPPKVINSCCQVDAKTFHVGSASLWRISNTPCLRFDDTVEESSYATFELPSNIDLTVNPVIKLILFPYDNQTSGSNFVFDLDLKYIALDESVAKADDENLSATIAVSNTQRIIAEHDFTLDASKIVAHDKIAIELRRDATNASDDRNGDACIIGIVFKYFVDK